MLEPNEKRAFDEMVTHLRFGDPKFDRRLDKLGSSRRRHRTILAVTLWVLSPIAIVVGGWTGFLMAVVGSAYAAHLVLKRHGFDGAPFPSRRSSHRFR